MHLSHFNSLLALLGSSTVVAAADTATPSAPASAYTPDLLEHLVDMLLDRFGLENSGNTAAHWGICVGLILLAWFLKTIVATAFFKVLNHFASKTETTLDDKLFPALEGPVKGLVVVLGSYAAIKVLKLSPTVDTDLGYLFKIAFPAVIFWGIINAISAIVDHLGEIATEKGMGIAAFLPLIKKTIIVVFIIVAGLTIIQSLGYQVGTFLAGLGIGGLAFALAAQDTIANLFASFVVAIDQPFHVGDVVQIGAMSGTVEGMGMRSTKIRTAARTLIALPNKTVVNEPITNFTRMPQRRVEQVIGLTYDTSPEKMETILADIREILKTEPGVHTTGSTAFFTDYADSALNIQIVYFSANPDWAKHLELRERINLKIMRAVAARGLSFAFPTRTLQFDDHALQALTAKKG